MVTISPEAWQVLKDHLESLGLDRVELHHLRILQEILQGQNLGAWLNRRMDVFMNVFRKMDDIIEDALFEDHIRASIYFCSIEIPGVSSSTFGLKLMESQGPAWEVVGFPQWVADRQLTGFHTLEISIFRKKDGVKIHTFTSSLMLPDVNLLCISLSADPVHAFLT